MWQRRRLGARRRLGRGCRHGGRLVGLSCGRCCGLRRCRLPAERTDLALQTLYVVGEHTGSHVRRAEVPLDGADAQPQVHQHDDAHEGAHAEQEREAILHDLPEESGGNLARSAGRGRPAPGCSPPRRAAGGALHSRIKWATKSVRCEPDRRSPLPSRDPNERTDRPPPAVAPGLTRIASPPLRRATKRGSPASRRAGGPGIRTAARGGRPVPRR